MWKERRKERRKRGRQGVTFAGRDRQLSPHKGCAWEWQCLVCISGLSLQLLSWRKKKLCTPPSVKPHIEESHQELSEDYEAEPGNTYEQRAEVCNEKAHIRDFPFKEKNFLYRSCPELLLFFFNSTAQSTLGIYIHACWQVKRESNINIISFQRRRGIYTESWFVLF